MTNYKELVKRLRDESNCDVLDDVNEAADAIENLLNYTNALLKIIEKQAAVIERMTDCILEQDEVSQNERS